MLTSKTRITDVGEQTVRVMWNCAGHVCRMNYGRRGRPKKRPRVELDAFVRDLPAMAPNRELGRSRRDTFAQQWDAEIGLIKIKKL